LGNSPRTRESPRDGNFIWSTNEREAFAISASFLGLRSAGEEGPYIDDSGKGVEQMIVVQKYRVVERVKDKRNERRVTLIQEIECEGEAGKFSKRLADISAGGMFVDTLNRFALGAAVTTRFHLPNSTDPIVASAKVVYVQERIGTGLEFVDLKPEDRKKIEEIVKLSSLRGYSGGGNVKRVLVAIPVTLKGTAKDGESFFEPTNIVMLAKNGASVRMTKDLDLDTRVLLAMPTGKEIEGRVLGIGREEVWIQCRSLAHSLGFRFP